MQSLNLINGNIITLDKQNPTASSLCIENGQISSLNSNILNAKTIDLNGATVIPGFIDAHFHLKNYGKQLDQLNLKGLQSLDEIEKIITQKLSTTNNDKWVLGFGWDQNLWDNQSFPLPTFLNSIAPNNPVYFTRIDGHASWVNDSAINKTNHTITQLDDIN